MNGRPLRRGPHVALSLGAVATLACGSDAPVVPLTPLAFENGPRVVHVSQTEITLALSASSDAEVRVIVQPAGVAAPTAEQILAGLAGNGDPATATASQSVLSGEEATFSVGPVERYHDHTVALVLRSAGEQVVAVLDVPNPLHRFAAEAGQALHRRSLLVSVGGELVIEAYFNGSAVDSLQDVRSVTKGLLALLVGQAIEDGSLTLQTTIGETFPARYLEGLDDVKRSVTVEQLMTMSSGFGWVESEFQLWTTLHDEIEAILERDLTSTPGTQFDYSTIDLQMLSVIFQESTGLDLHEYAKQHLFADVHVSDSRWVGFETGYKMAGGFSFLPARGLINLGQMVLDQGRFAGRQVVPSAYIAEMVSPKMTFPSYLNTGGHITSQWFGYLWWESDVGGLEGYMTAGYGGQNLMVFPEVDMVIVTSSVANVNALTADEQQRQNWALVADLIEVLEIAPRSGS